MKSIGAQLAKKLELQAKEAQYLKKDLLADDIEIQLKSHTIRDDENDKFSYSRGQYEEDMRDGFLALAVRIMDYYGKSTNDVGTLQNKLAKFADQLEQEVCLDIHTECTKIGAYEPALLGQKVASKNKPDYDFEING